MDEEYFDKNLLDLVTKIISKNPKERLGYNDGKQEIMSHPWFEGVDFDNILYDRAPLVFKKFHYFRSKSFLIYPIPIIKNFVIFIRNFRQSIVKKLSDLILGGGIDIGIWDEGWYEDDEWDDEEWDDEEEPPAPGPRRRRPDDGGGGSPR